MEAPIYREEPREPNPEFDRCVQLLRDAYWRFASEHQHGEIIQKWPIVCDRDAEGLATMMDITCSTCGLSSIVKAKLND